MDRDLEKASTTWTVLFGEKLLFAGPGKKQWIIQIDLLSFCTCQCYCFRACQWPCLCTHWCACFDTCPGTLVIFFQSTYLCTCRATFSASKTALSKSYPCHWAQCRQSKLFGQVITVVDSTSTHVPMLKSFKIEFEIQHTVHTMDCYDPDFEAFESNFRPILRARESGKTAALVSNLCPKASDPQ